MEKRHAFANAVSADPGQWFVPHTPVRSQPVPASAANPSPATRSQT